MGSGSGVTIAVETTSGCILGAAGECLLPARFNHEDAGKEQMTQANRLAVFRTCSSCTPALRPGITITDSGNYEGSHEDGTGGEIEARSANVRLLQFSAGTVCRPQTLPPLQWRRSWPAGCAAPAWTTGAVRSCLTLLTPVSNPCSMLPGTAVCCSASSIRSGLHRALGQVPPRFGGLDRCRD